jgi:hypothetical protein
MALKGGKACLAATGPIMRPVSGVMSGVCTGLVRRRYVVLLKIPVASLEARTCWCPPGPVNYHSLSTYLWLPVALVWWQLTTTNLPSGF